MVADPPITFESDWLDFRDGAHLNLDKPDVQRIWSNALSGFANVGGGVLIWGIKSKKSSEGIEGAGELSLVTEPLKLRTKLMELHHQSTDPPVQPIRVE